MITTSTRSRTRVPSRKNEGSNTSWLTSLFQNNIITTILAMIVLIPLLTGTDVLTTKGKLYAFEGLGAILLMLTLSQARLAGLVARVRPALLAGPNPALALLVVLCVVSCAVSPYAAFSRVEMMRIGICTLLYFVLVYNLRGRGHLQTLTDGLLVVTAAVSLYGLAEMSVNSSMVEGSFGSHELLGSFLMLMLPLALALGLSDRGDNKRQIAAQAVALLATTCLLMARTRSAWLGSAVSLVVLSVLAWRFIAVPKTAQAGTSFTLKQLKMRKHLIIGPVLILGGALALLILMSQTGLTLQKRAATLAQVDIDPSFQTRLAMDRGALHAAAARPLLGWGLGTYPVIAERFTGFGDAPAQVLAHGTSHSNLAHNYYLQTAAEIGFLGLAAYLAALVLFFVTGIKALWTLENGLHKTVLLGCLAAMAGQVVDALGSPAYNFASVSLFQWVLMGMGMYAAGLGKRVPHTKTADEPASQPLGMSAPILRGLQYGFCGLVGLGLVSQIIPTMTSAAANTTQTCVADSKTLRTGVVGTSILHIAGESTRVDSLFGGTVATQVVYTETFTPGGQALVASIVADTAHSITITRNATKATHPATVTVTATNVYMGTTTTNSVVIQLR